MKRKKLFWFSLATGILTLGGGTGIFILWWIVRAWFAIDYTSLELYGLYWIFLSIPIALTGLITSSILISANPNNNTLRTSIPMVLLLLNIPAVFIILYLHSEISDRVYIKLFNKSGRTLELQLSSPSFETKLGTLENNKSIIDYYIPTYTGNPGDESQPEVEEVILNAKTENMIHELQMPYAMKGWCEGLIITDSLTLKYGAIRIK
ncbi:MAG: hypothetical protein ACFHWX_05810 [Bacteroidota bacterium]